MRTVLATALAMNSPLYSKFTGVKLDRVEDVLKEVDAIIESVPAFHPDMFSNLVDEKLYEAAQEHLTECDCGSLKFTVISYLGDTVGVAPAEQSFTHADVSGENPAHAELVDLFNVLRLEPLLGDEKVRDEIESVEGLDAELEVIDKYAHTVMCEQALEIFGGIDPAALFLITPWVGVITEPSSRKYFALWCYLTGQKFTSEQVNELEAAATAYFGPLQDLMFFMDGGLQVPLSMVTIDAE